MNENPWSSLSFTVVIPPRGKSTPQAQALIDANGVPIRNAQGRIILIHHPSEKQAQDTKKLTSLLLEHRPPSPLRGPIILGVRAFFDPPRNMPDALKPMVPEGTTRNKWFEGAVLSGEARPISRPDWSNIQKNIEDVMLGTFFVDDSQIIGNLPGSGKWYGSPARYEIELLYLRRFQEPGTEQSAIHPHKDGGKKHDS